MSPRGRNAARRRHPTGRGTQSGRLRKDVPDIGWVDPTARAAAVEAVKTESFADWLQARFRRGQR